MAKQWQHRPLNTALQSATLSHRGAPAGAHTRLRHCGNRVLSSTMHTMHSPPSLNTTHSLSMQHHVYCVHRAYSQWGSNPRPMAHKTIALTTEL